MQSYLIQLLIGILESAVPNAKPLIDAIQAQITAGKIGVGDIENDAKLVIKLGEDYLPKYKAFLEDLIQDISDIDKTVADFKAANA